MPLFKVPRQLDGPQASCSIIDETVIITLGTSGANASLGLNAISSGDIVCLDLRTVQNGNSASADLVLHATHAQAGQPYGVYQGLQGTLTNASTSATSTAEITVRQWGPGVVLVNGNTTNVLVGDNICVLPGSSTVSGSQGVKFAPTTNVTVQGGANKVAVATATSGATTFGASLATATNTLVNGFINCLAEY